jgi:hypothetical protein
MQTKIKQFYDSLDDFRQFYSKLKQTPCPHCKRLQHLILHGPLYGYDDKDADNIIVRGHRIFCSNRNKRQGCGRTFSLLASHILKNFILSGYSFWSFLRNIALKWNKLKSFQDLHLSFSNTTVYRLWSLFDHNQSYIRSVLFRNASPPILLREHNPLLQTIHHINTIFKEKPCPISAFQQHYQTHFIS